MDRDNHTEIPLADLLLQIRNCRHCEAHLPLGLRPVLRASATARLLIIGQAPGARVHASGIPFDDLSGDRLRDWLQLSREVFYDESRVAIMPMGFCYPGRGKSGDLPPRPECAPLWHEALLAHMPGIELVLVIGSYAQQHYLDERLKACATAKPALQGASKEAMGETPKKTRQSLTQRVKRWRDFGPRYIPLPHPSPRNTLWLKRNPWFEEEVVPELRAQLRALEFK